MNPLATIAAFLGLFLGGGAVGGGVANAFAPDSFIADCAGFFALPVAFAVGLQLWYGLALFRALVAVAAHVVFRSRRPAIRPRGPATLAIPGSFVFLPLSTSAAGIAGIIVGIASRTHSIWLITLVFVALGAAHGTLAWRLARAGVLIPPESI